MSGKVNLADLVKQAEKEGQVGSAVFKPQNGDNRIRVVAGPLPHNDSFTDKKTGESERRFKWLVRIIDRADGQVKPYFMAHTVMKALRTLQEDEEYAFDEMPMPYDVVVKVENAGTRDAKYQVLARKATKITADEQNAIDALPTLEEYQQQLASRREQPERSFDPDVVGSEAPF